MCPCERHLVTPVWSTKCASECRFARQLKSSINQSFPPCLKVRRDSVRGVQLRSYVYASMHRVQCFPGSLNQGCLKVSLDAKRSMHASRSKCHIMLQNCTMNQIYTQFKAALPSVLHTSPVFLGRKYWGFFNMHWTAFFGTSF